MRDMLLVGAPSPRGRSVLDKLKARKSHPPALFQPLCVQCAGKMDLASRTPCQALRRRFERHTFACDKCGNKQTYTMGTSEARLSEIWGTR
jgi:hypothetical protein